MGKYKGNATPNRERQLGHLNGISRDNTGLEEYGLFYRFYSVIAVSIIILLCLKPHLKYRRTKLSQISLRI